jgi:hypothetical protein
VRSLVLAALSASLSSCAVPIAESSSALHGSGSTPADAFFERVSRLCGQRFSGRMVTADPADAELAQQPLVMHVRDCEAREIRIPFHVGADQSRTWVLTRTAEGLRLKHDHRHEDGTEDALSQYGGDSVAPGTAGRQEFPADAFSKELFQNNAIPASAENVWALEVEPGKVFAYELRRPNRHFRVEFDLASSKP